jgi:hypothetical protein
VDWVVKPLNIKLINLQQSMFKFTMKTQAPKAMSKLYDTNLVTKL